MERSFSGHEWEKSNSEDENEFLSLGNPEKYLFQKKILKGESCLIYFNLSLFSTSVTSFSCLNNFSMFLLLDKQIYKYRIV